MRLGAHEIFERIESIDQTFVYPWDCVLWHSTALSGTWQSATVPNQCRGRLRFRAKGSAGGHNGIKSVIAHVGGQNFKRLKLGIGHPTKMTVVNWVLSQFSAPERITFDETVTKAVKGLQEWILTDDFNQVMNRYNG